MTQQQQASGLAIASLVLGILSLLTCTGPVLGIPGLICGIVALVKAKKGEAGGKGIAVAGTIISGVGIVSISVTLSMLVLCQAKEKGHRAQCSGNMKQIGVACLMYSGDYNGYFPSSFDILDSTECLRASKVYNCPGADYISGNDTLPSEGDYLYFGAGIRDDNRMATQVVILCDKVENHHGEWVNVLFADGHVEGVRGGTPEELAEYHGWIFPGINDPEE